MVNSQVLIRVILCSLLLEALPIFPPAASAASSLKQASFFLSQSDIEHDIEGCQPEESTFVETETEHYWVYICGGDNPVTYVGIDKQDPSFAIRLPLSDYDPQGNFFEAVNGNVSYILAKTPRGMFLTVTQGSQELLREPVLQPW